MNQDAQEAAIGLLSLSPSNTFPPLVSNPLKRKQHPQANHQAPHRSNASKGRSKPPEKEKQRKEVVEQVEERDVSSESIRCICGSTFDDGFSIACDDCSRWCHAACFDIVDGSVPEEWRCWICNPRPIDEERAARLQRNRQRAIEDERRALTARPPPTDHSKKRRRMSTASSTQAAHPPPVSEDTPVDVCTDGDEPRSHYVHIAHDIVSSSFTTSKLRQHAQNWRGITALTPYPPTTTLQPLPAPPTSVRPPSYALHTTSAVRSDTLLTPFTSTITPSSAYLCDPLNGYAHLGMPKPYVHLVGPPLDLALDARVAGNEARFVRSGCWPNAVLRPVLCREGRRKQAARRRSGAGDGKARGLDDEDWKEETDEQKTLGFAVFALRDLKANEEVVLGWEWDDGNAVHALPALIETPNMFP
jgi:hypothetical protein